MTRTALSTCMLLMVAFGTLAPSTDSYRTTVFGSSSVAGLASIGPECMRKMRMRERRWFVLERPRRDTNGGSETEVTVTSKLP